MRRGGGGMRRGGHRGHGDQRRRRRRRARRPRLGCRGQKSARLGGIRAGSRFLGRGLGRRSLSCRRPLGRPLGRRPLGRRPLGRLARRQVRRTGLGFACGVIGLSRALGWAALAMRQLIDIHVKRPVQRDDADAGGVTHLVHLAPQRVSGAVGQQRVEHHRVAGQHRLQHVARHQAHDHLDGELGAEELLVAALTRPFAQGAGHVGDDVGEEFLDAEVGLAVHDRLGSGPTFQTYVNISNGYPRQRFLLDGWRLTPSEA